MAKKYNPDTSMNILSLIKFGKKEHLEQLLLDGTFYCNTIDYFTKIEDNELRGDHYENVFNIRNYPKGTIIEVTPYDNSFKPLKLKTINFQLREKYENLNGNLLCLYSVTSDDFSNKERLIINLKNERFGSHFLLLKDLGNIFPRIISALDELGYKYKTGIVSYYDKNKVNRNINLFEKPNEFMYQKEFRIFIENDKNEPISFCIGSIKNQAQIFEISVLKDLEYVNNIKLQN